MAANTNPIFSKVGDIQWTSAVITTASTAKDGTGATLVYTADATNGGYISKIRFVPIGTNVATVARVFINNGSSVAVGSNNTYWDSVTLSATTNSETASIGYVELPFGFALPPGYKIYVAIGTTVSAGIQCTVIGGKY